MMEANLRLSADNPPPRNYTAGFFTGRDGVALRYAIFRTERSIARGTIIIVQGRNESIEKYFETIRDLNEHGFWVATFDLRGQGGSERLLPDPRKGHVGRFADYEEDLEAFLQKVVLPDTRLPFYLIAHSTGGLITLSAAPRLANRIERIVVASPFIALRRNGMSQGAIGRIAGACSLLGLGGCRLTADLGEPPFDGNVLTSDPVRFERNRRITRQYPALAVGPPTARWIYEATKTMKKVHGHQHLASIMIPTLVLAGSNDQLIPIEAHEKLAEYFRAGHLITIPGARHEIFQERDIFRAQAMEAIKAFIPGADTEEREAGDAEAAAEA
ncbi:alpha/beta fold hydrolase [Rhizobium sp. PAMB 3182]